VKRNILNRFLLAWAAATSCAGGPESNAVAARVGEEHLSSDRLAELLVLGQPLPLRQDVAAGLARQWVELTALAHGLASGDSFLDTALALESAWFEVEQALIAAHRDTSAIHAIQLSPREIDSIYAAGELRIIAHIVKAVPETADSAFKAQQRRAAQAILDQLLEGVPWTRAVAASDDAQSRAQNGSLGLIERGQTVPEFERVAFALRPGEVSPVTETRFGYHIIYRPRLSDVRGAYANFVTAELRARLDSAQGEAELRGARFRIPPGGFNNVRRVAGDLTATGSEADTVAIFTNGAFTTAQLLPYLARLSPETRTEMASSPDREIERFVRSLVLHRLRLEVARADGTTLSDSARNSFSTAYRESLEAVRRDAGLAGDARQAKDSVATRVDRYLEAVVARRVSPPTLPAALVSRLLAQNDWSVDSAGVARAVERAQRLLAATVEPGS
jgi:PPIC-type PPIASE domain